MKSTKLLNLKSNIPQWQKILSILILIILLKSFWFCIVYMLFREIKIILYFMSITILTRTNQLII